MAEPTFPTLSQHMDRLTADIAGLAAQALVHFQPRAIHDARVSTRRLKAALDLLKPALPRRPRKRLARELRQLRRTLGPLRDLDVMLKHLREFPPAGQHAISIKWLCARFQKKRQTLRKDLKPTHRIVSAAKAWRDLHTVVADLDCRTPELISRSLAAQLDTFTHSASQLKMPGRPARTLRSDPHAVRIAAKRLRYTLELAAAMGLEFPKPHLKIFKALQDALGLWHDFVVLTQTAMRESLDAQVSVHDPALGRALLSLIETFSRRADDYLAQFGRLWTRHGNLLARDIRRLMAAACAPAGSETRRSV